MATPVLPTVPADLIAGNVASSADMNQLVSCCNFLINAKPVAHVWQTTTQTITSTSGPGTAVTFDTKTFDTDGVWSSGSNNKLTIQTPGFYKVRYGVSPGSSAVMNAAVWGTSGSNNPQGSGITIGGNGFWGSFSVGTATTNSAGASGIFPFYLYVGDFLQVKAYGSSSWSTTNGVPNATFFSLEWVSS